MLYVFKLISGEDIFALVTDESETGYIIEDPCTVVFNPNAGVAMKHWMSLVVNNTTYISKDNILSNLGKANELAEYYYHTYMYEAKKVNTAALESYHTSVNETDSLVDDVFEQLIAPDKNRYN